MSRLAYSALLPTLLALLLVGCQGRRPEFNIAGGRDQLARAFGQPGSDVEIYEDGPGDAQGEWIIGFKLKGFRPLLQARFVGRDDTWVLDRVREFPLGSAKPQWVDVGAQIGRVRQDATEKAQATMKRIRELAEFIDRYYAEHGVYPEMDLVGVAQVVLAAGYTTDWHHDADAWGNRFAYHAAPEGQGYIIISSAADGKFDEPLRSYFDKTDEGLEAYGGVVDERGADIVFATGSFVQSPVSGD